MVTKKAVDTGGGDCHHAIPAIWLYPKKTCTIEITLDFKGKGFMTDSSPEYNAKWLIEVDTAATYLRYKKNYGGYSENMFLDYDGFREGPFQKNMGWCIEMPKFQELMVKILQEVGFKQNEIDDADYNFLRMIADKWTDAQFVLIYPQEKAIVDQSVALHIKPSPTMINRIWYWLRASKRKEELMKPAMNTMIRKGYYAVELGFMSDQNVPKNRIPGIRGNKLLLGFSRAR